MLFKIVTDAECPLPDSLTRSFDLTLLPSLNSAQEYTPENITFSNENPLPKIAGQTFERLFREGNDLLYAGPPPHSSEAFQTVLDVLGRTAARFPGRKWAAVSLLSPPAGLALLVLYASELRREGKTLAEVRDWLEENRLRAACWSAVGNPDGSVLLLRANETGSLVPAETAPDREQAVARLCGIFAETAALPEGQTVCIAQSGCPAAAEELRSAIARQTGAGRFAVGTSLPPANAPWTLAVSFMTARR